MQFGGPTKKKNTKLGTTGVNIYLEQKSQITNFITWQLAKYFKIQKSILILLSVWHISILPFFIWREESVNVFVMILYLFL